MSYAAVAPVYVYRSYPVYYSSPIYYEPAYVPVRYGSGPIYYEDVQLRDEAAATPAPRAEEIVPPEGVDASALSLVELRFVTGLAALRSGEWDRAIESLRLAVEESGGHRVPHLYLALALFLDGQFEAAGDQLVTTLDSWTEFPTYRWDPRNALGDREAFEKQIAALETAVGGAPQNPWLQLVRGVMLASSGDPARARASFELLAARQPWPGLSGVITAFLERTRDPDLAPAAPADDPTARFLESSNLTEIRGLGLEPR